MGESNETAAAIAGGDGSARDDAAALAQIDAYLDEAGLGEHRTTGRILLTAAVITGPNDDAIAEMLGLDAAFVRERGDRLRASGVWADGKTHCNWFDDANDEGGLAFLLDVMCAEGLVARAGARS